MRCAWRIASCLFAGMVFLSSTVDTAGEETAANDFRVLDGFERVGEWQAGATEDSEASVRTTEGARGHALQLSYAFRAAGFAYARRALPLDLSNNFEMVFQLRGHAPKSTFEVKLIDESGLKVQSAILLSEAASLVNKAVA